MLDQPQKWNQFRILLLPLRRRLSDVSFSFFFLSCRPVVASACFLGLAGVDHVTHDRHHRQRIDSDEEEDARETGTPAGVAAAVSSARSRGQFGVVSDVYLRPAIDHAARTAPCRRCCSDSPSPPSSTPRR
ncbi:hypothetical protein MTO96_043992 [Rhipicephalus appendiculatus]